MEPLDSLVRAAQKGDAEAFNRVVERFQDMACASAYAMMRDAPLGKEETEPNPTGQAKCGVKRSLLVEGHGFPLGLAVKEANRNDFKMEGITLESIPIMRPKQAEENPRHL